MPLLQQFARRKGFCVGGKILETCAFPNIA